MLYGGILNKILHKVTSILMDKLEKTNQQESNADIPVAIIPDAENHAHGKSSEGQTNKAMDKETELFSKWKEGLKNELIVTIQTQINPLEETINYFRKEYLGKDVPLRESVSEGVNSNPKDFSRIEKVIDEINDKMSSIEDMGKRIENIDYNVRSNNTNYSKDYVRGLLDRIDEYQEDVYLKLMKKYFINVYIGVYRYIALLRFNAIKDGSSFDCKELEGVLKEIERGLSDASIEVQRSKEGDEFDDKEMILSGKFERISTNEVSKKGKVAFSVLPKFTIVFPENNLKFSLNNEEVALYEQQII